MKPSFLLLDKGYPRRIKRQPLYDALGWPDLKAQRWPECGVPHDECTG